MIGKTECPHPYASDMTADYIPSYQWERARCAAPTVTSNPPTTMASTPPASTSPASAQKASQSSDPVRQPSHYTRLTPEPLDVIEAWNLPFHLGAVIKYITRAGHKDDEIQDLEKAAYYLERHITLRRKSPQQMELFSK